MELEGMARGTAFLLFYLECFCAHTSLSAPFHQCLIRIRVPAEDDTMNEVMAHHDLTYSELKVYDESL